VQKLRLREVAKAAPCAPQVYSSLGMVYESMLTETEGEVLVAHTVKMARRKGFYG